MKITVTIILKVYLQVHLFFHRNRKQELNFQQVGGLVTRNSFAFCLQQVSLYFKDMPNSIDFYKRIFLHVSPVRIISSMIEYKQKRLN